MTSRRVGRRAAGIFTAVLAVAASAAGVRASDHEPLGLSTGPLSFRTPSGSVATAQLVAGAVGGTRLSLLVDASSPVGAQSVLQVRFVEAIAAVSTTGERNARTSSRFNPSTGIVEVAAQPDFAPSTYGYQVDIDLADTLFEGLLLPKVTLLEVQPGLPPTPATPEYDEVLLVRGPLRVGTALPLLPGEPLVPPGGALQLLPGGALLGGPDTSVRGSVESAPGSSVVVEPGGHLTLGAPGGAVTLLGDVEVQDDATLEIIAAGPATLGGRTDVTGGKIAAVNGTRIGTTALEASSRLLLEQRVDLEETAAIQAQMLLAARELREVDQDLDQQRLLLQQQVQAYSRTMGLISNSLTMRHETTRRVIANVGSRLVGDVRLAGGLAPGGLGGTETIPVDGDLHVTALGTLLVGVAGTAPGAQHDQVVVGGVATLADGAWLEVAFLDGFVPAVGDTFDVLVAEEIEAGFVILDVPPLPVGRTLVFLLETDPDGPDVLRLVVLPLGGQGCGPGFWKQPKHAGDWPEGIDPSTPFAAVFEDAFPGQSLRAVLRQGGGGLNALGRQVVAAYLNAASMGVVYALDPAGVVARFDDLHPASKARYEALKDQLEEQNSLGCPL